MFRRFESRKIHHILRIDYRIERFREGGEEHGGSEFYTFKKEKKKIIFYSKGH